MVWQEPHLGQRNIEAGESFVRRLCYKYSSQSNQNLIIQEKILIKTAIIKSKFLNHKKQILDIYQVIIFISQYSTQLRLDKQGSSPLLSDHYLIYPLPFISTGVRARLNRLRGVGH
jgi:hypothetical protein